MKLDKTIRELLKRQQEEDMQLLYGLDNGDFENKEIGRYVLRRMNAIRKLFGKAPISVEEMRRRRRADREVIMGRDNPAWSNAQLNKHAERQEDKMTAYETVFSHRRFEVLRAGKGRYYLQLRGGIRHASPGLTRITEEEAMQLIAEHAARELRRGQPVEEAGREKVNKEASMAATEQRENRRPAYRPGSHYGLEPYGEVCRASIPVDYRRWPGR